MVLAMVCGSPSPLNLRAMAGRAANTALGVEYPVRIVRIDRCSLGLGSQNGRFRSLA